MSLLSIEDPEIVSWSLSQLSQNTQRNWFWYLDQLPAMQSIPARFPELAQQTNLLLARIYFFADDLQCAVDCALEAGALFDPCQRDLFVDSLLALMVTTYIDSQKNVDAELSQEESARLLKIKGVVEQVLGKSFGKGGAGGNLLLLGLAIETRDFVFFVRLLKKTSDKELGAMFDWIKRRVYEPLLKAKMLGMFLEEFQNRGAGFMRAISQCLFQMGRVEEHADFILEMAGGDIYLFMLIMHLIYSSYLQYLLSFINWSKLLMSPYLTIVKHT